MEIRPPVTVVVAKGEKNYYPPLRLRREVRKWNLVRTKNTYGTPLMRLQKVLRNEARDYLDELARRRSREISFSELPVEVMEQLSVCDDYFAEDRTFDVLGYIVQIASDELAEAITSLPAEKRNIILLSYFLEMTDMEIAELLNMVRSSVAYRRTATLKLLKELMGGKTDDS